MTSQKNKIKILKIFVPINLLLACLFSLWVFAWESVPDTVGMQESPTISADTCTSPKNFSEAKRAARILYQDHRQTFYCGCKFDKHNKIDLQSCGYKIQEDPRRAKRLEWEHIVPISHLAAHLPCWKNKLCCNKQGQCFKGRRCCQKSDPQFCKMEADLHNLVPEIGELNAARSNYRFGVLPFVAEGQFGNCEIKIDSETRRVEPRITTRGVIARVYFYMSDSYGFHLSDSQRQLFQSWNALYPPDDWEIERNKRIKEIQGNDNPYISHYLEKKQS